MSTLNQDPASSATKARNHQSHACFVFAWFRGRSKAIPDPPTRAATNVRTRMRMCTVPSLLMSCAIAAPASAQQTFTGRLSDSMCGALHRSRAAADSDRQCLLACISRLAKYVLVDGDNRVIPIANQDAMGLPLYAGRPVRITGEMQGSALLVTKVEAIPAHLHIGHVMTNWRDTPGARGFLPVAMDEARVAVEHARLAAKGASLEDIRLHAGHVLHALDPGVESKGPGAGYGVRKAVDGAIQHLGLALTADGATANVATFAPGAVSALASVVKSLDQAVAAAQRVRSARDAGEAAGLAADLVTLTERMSQGGLQEAMTQMNMLLKAEGLSGAPR